MHLVSHDMEYRDYPCNQTREELIEEIIEAIDKL
jgi:hypothetical protein